MFNVSLGFAAWLCQECLMFNVQRFLLPRVAVKTPTRGSVIFMMQRYHILIAVNE